ncbi:hypothetical protein [Stenotrophomonas bentonitica]|jgi:hypothetical protein|uniref:hypothetical protein n=1 Tax=Stenotrophomonas bentonitica TaxID=1450134 RepID=UPI0031B9A663|nr:hypothetical protein [Stenotrophomonas maltophilia]
MTKNVLHFTPRDELEPRENIQQFITICRKSKVLGANCQFDSDVWSLGSFKGHNKVHRAVFSTYESVRGGRSVETMPQPFLDFAKATLIYLHDCRPVVSQSIRVSALRFLEAALRQGNKASRPTAVDIGVLDSAVELAVRSVSPSVAYRVGGQLELIAKFMREKNFISLTQNWNCSLVKPKELGSRISEQAMQARQDKLPSAAALRGLGGIFQEAVKPLDVLVSSYSALLSCAPERINEALRLERNCIVEGSGRFQAKLGFRWPGSKGAKDTIKWLPTQMASIAREALRKLLIATHAANRVATWYTKNPGVLFLGDDVAHLRGVEVLIPAQIALILWGDESAFRSAFHWARSAKKLEPVQMGGRQMGFRFSDVEEAVIAMLPRTFPFVPGAPNLLCRDSIGVVLVNELHAHRGTYTCMFSCVDYGAIANALTTHDGQPSIFTRFGYAEDDGTPINMNTHSLRHYLNMLAQMGGMSDVEIAIFSGRKDVAQNRAYDHMTSDEVQAPVSQAIASGFMANLVDKPSKHIILRSRFSEAGASAAHTTAFGWCVHDFASEPCPMYRDCINCEEQECVKGEEQKERNLRALKKETESLLVAAKLALEEEEYGADTWVKHQELTLERIDSLLAILEDNSVSAGARIRLNIVNAALIVDRSEVQRSLSRSKNLKLAK